ncbi:MAG TPA: heavy-metal-associated domain-containing protein [Marmoricola sp.]|jgi:copper chaperone CopZ
MLSGTPRTFVGSTTFAVAGMVDADSRHAVSARIAAVPGVDAVAVDPASGRVTVRAARPVDRADITAAIGEAGFTLLP